jgi:hypothetical protein
MRHLLFIALLAAPALGQSERLLDAIRQVESGGDCSLIGDHGKAIGSYQIHEPYWRDAVQADPSIGGTYQDCRDEQYARQVVKAYLHRYGRGRTDAELARIHNGGPSGHRKSATLRYLRKVQQALQAAAQDR